MEYTARLPVAQALPARLRSRIDPPALSAWTLAFALVTYLAMRDGGYDTIVRSEVGVAVWWIVLLGALAGILPARIGRAGWIAIGLLGGFAVWTGLAVGWSQNAEDTVVELGREAAYLGFLVLAIAVQGRTGVRHTVNGLASAIGMVTVLAVLSRLHPQAFPANVQFQFLGPAAGRRLSYPLNYWNALAAFAAMGVPLLATVALNARTVATRALAAAVLPLSALCLYLTISRGGVLEIVVGLTVLLLLTPRRVETATTLILGAAGAAILIWAASQRPAIRTGLRTPAALDQGTKMLLLALVVGAGVACLQAALALALRYYERPGVLQLRRATTAKAGVLAGAGAVLVAVLAGVPGRLDHLWQQFKAPPGAVAPGSAVSVFSRLSAINGNGRYQFWQAALHANATRPLTGIGPGTFQYWWAHHPTTGGFVRNAHSLYLETLAEAGIVGLVLIGGLLIWALATGVRRSVRTTDSLALRTTIAGAVAALATFMTAAAIEWVWQLAAMAAAALVLIAVIVAGRDDDPTAVDAATAGRRVPRAITGLIAIVALAAIAIPLADSLALRQSQNAAAAGDLGTAYRAALTAERLEPYAATPRLQAALVLEEAGDLSAAAVAAQAATRNASTDWQVWLTLARIDARRGAETAALAAFRRARSLNPLNPLFGGRT